MALIRVTPATLRSKATELEGLNNQYKNKVNGLNDKETTLYGQWEGDANTAFHQAFQTNKGYLDDFSTAVGKYIEALNTAAEAYDKAEAEAAGMVQ